jgi:hypothetical protein
LGHILVGFSWLEASIEDHIAKLAKLTPAFVSPPMSDLDFKEKVAVLSDLVGLQLQVSTFNAGNEEPAEIWLDFQHMLRDCEKFRDQFLHSALTTFDRAYAESNPGEEDKLWPFGLTGSALIDRYDHILMVQNDLDQFLCADEERPVA